MSSSGSLVEKVVALSAGGLAALRRFLPHLFRFAFFIISRSQTPTGFRLGFLGWRSGRWRSSPAPQVLSVGVEIRQERLLYSAADRSAELPVYGRDPFLALSHLISSFSPKTLSAAPAMHISKCAGRLAGRPTSRGRTRPQLVTASTLDDRHFANWELHLSPSQ